MLGLSSVEGRAAGCGVEGAKEGVRVTSSSVLSRRRWVFSLRGVQVTRRGRRSWRLL